MTDLIFKVLLLVVIIVVLVFILIKEIKRRREEIIERIIKLKVLLLCSLLATIKLLAYN